MKFFCVFLKVTFIFIVSFTFPNQKVFSQSIGKDFVKDKKKLENATSDSARVRLYSILSSECDEKDIEIYATEGLKLAESLLLLKEDTLVLRNKASLLGNLGYAYKDKGNVLKALEYYQKALQILEATKDTSTSMLSLLNNIGLIYKEQGDSVNALNNYNKSLFIANRKKMNKEICQSYNNIATLFVSQNKLDEALSYFKKSLVININRKSNSDVAINCLNIAKVYLQKGNFPLALEYINKSIAIRVENNDLKGLSSAYATLAKIYFKMNNLDAAKEYGEKSYRIAKELNSISLINNVTNVLKEIYRKLGFYEESLEMYDQYILSKDSLNNNDLKRNVLRKQLEYEYNKEKEVTNLKIEQQDTKMKQEKTLRFVLYGGLILVLVFSAFLFNRFKLTQKQNGIIETQKHLVEEKQKEILDSITYAKRLQEAILPPEEFILKQFPENFILYLPKDIVAGDFYWMEQKDGLSFIAAADSTGHGVPGAMVSVVCSNALNRAVKEFNLRCPGEILDKTRELVQETFEKSTSDVKDGMDISLLCFDQANNNISWAGANNPLWYIVNNQLKKIVANKQAIGKVDFPAPFITHTIEKADKQSTFFLFTDGFADQFGGSKGKKFKYRQLEDFLVKNANYSMELQREKLKEEFEQWKGDLEQVDDVCIIGIRI